eukprot:9490000-Pyramimonas_sp.AAC.1
MAMVVLEGEVIQALALEDKAEQRTKVAQAFKKAASPWEIQRSDLQPIALKRAADSIIKFKSAA